VSFEVLQHAAHIAAVETEVEAEIFGGNLVAVRQLEEDSNFSQRKLAFEEVLLQNADLTGVEAVEAADELDGVGG